MQQPSVHCLRWCSVSSRSLLLLLLTDSGHSDLYYLGMEEEHVLTMVSSWLGLFYVNVCSIMRKLSCCECGVETLS